MYIHVSFHATALAYLIFPRFLARKRQPVFWVSDFSCYH